MKKFDKQLIQLPEKQSGILPFLIPFIICVIISSMLPDFFFDSSDPIWGTFEIIIHAILGVAFMWIMLLIEAPFFRSRNKGKFTLNKKGETHHE